MVLKLMKLKGGVLYRVALKIRDRLQAFGLKMIDVIRGVLAAAGKTTVAFVFSIVAALGIALIMGALAVLLVNSPWFNRLLVPATFGIAEVAMLVWLLRASSVGDTITRFRYVVIGECLVFGVLGMLVAVDDVSSLFVKSGLSGVN